jgi:murein DD-endopeptidase MepM/ murein hydrolase activator NlpD
MQQESLREEFKQYLQFFWEYLSKRTYKVFRYFEKSKDFIVDGLYQKRGKYAQPFLHSSMVGLMFVGVTFGPLLISEQALADELAEGTLPTSVVLGTSTDVMSDQEFITSSGQGVLDFRGGEIISYEVREGDTLGSISEKFNLQLNTILWVNDMTESSKIKPGQTIKIPPVDGVVHTVKRGETIYSIAKKYGLEGEAGAQGIVNYPFNTFTDDENFGIAVGQTVMVPDGAIIAPTYVPNIASFLPTTPNAGAVSAAGSFVWPASGRISQGYKFYHKAIDIASKGGGPILAADAGRVTLTGWPDGGGYGNRVVIDHGNGFVTLYAHLSMVRVVAGQTVNRGDVIGDMGTTGRSTGVHLHFEVHQNGVVLNPLSFLQ